MELERRAEKGISVLQIKGRLDATNAKELESTILEMLEKETMPLLLNMEQLDYISSAGLRVLILALKKEGERKKGFALCSLQESVADVLEIAGFLPLFQVYKTEPEGVEALS